MAIAYIRKIKYREEICQGFERLGFEVSTLKTMKWKLQPQDVVVTTQYTAAKYSPYKAQVLSVGDSWLGDDRVFIRNEKRPMAMSATTVVLPQKVCLRDTSPAGFVLYLAQRGENATTKRFATAPNGVFNDSFRNFAREQRIRYHPGSKKHFKVPDGVIKLYPGFATLEQHLLGAYCSVTYSSTAHVISLLHGIPCIALGSGLILGEACGDTLFTASQNLERLSEVFTSVAGTLQTREDVMSGRGLEGFIC